MRFLGLFLGRFAPAEGVWGCGAVDLPAVLWSVLGAYRFFNNEKVDFENDLYDVDQADIVPSGVAEVARLQGMGYSYIKP